MAEGWMWDFNQKLDEQIIEYGKFRLKQTQEWILYAVMERFTKLSQLCDADSPPEKVLLWELILCLPEEMQVLPQQEIKLPSFTYRVDFLLRTPNGKELVVECDGGRHQREPEQIKEDKKRDRHLQMYGWKVLRFTADEVFWQADTCGREIRQTLWEMMK
ncbi:MAG: endonuclease domain-containing protein [Elusimicrobia bacterium]|nr:endonuclease domain-containing protein [Elusimicrobiota bacterium]